MNTLIRAPPRFGKNLRPDHTPSAPPSARGRIAPGRFWRRPSRARPRGRSRSVSSLSGRCRCGVRKRFTDLRAWPSIASSSVPWNAGGFCCTSAATSTAFPSDTG